MNRIHEKKTKKFLIRAGIVILLLLFISIVLMINVQYEKKSAYAKGKINIMINNNNVTKKLKKDLWQNEKKVIYMSKEDVANYFDKYIYWEEKTNQLITTYGEKIGTLPLNENQMKINDVPIDLLSGAVKKEDTYYLPISSMARVYNVNIEYIESEKILLLDSLDRKLVKADVAKNTSVKYKTSMFSKTVDRIQKGEKVVCIENLKNNWTKVRTSKGYIGYVKTNILQNVLEVRSDIRKEESTEKINLVWDYFSEYVSAPDRNGTQIEGINVVSPSFFSLVSKGNGAIHTNVGTKGVNYIKWAHQNQYKVWGMFSNNSYKETTSTILNSYELRTQVINQIVNLAVQYDLDGINIDFENMNTSDREMFSRFIIELKPKLQEVGKILSVDVTTLDGGGDWSECYHRNIIGDVADYTILMAYDQYGIGSSKPGTTAGYNWVENNIKKMIDREEVKSNKILLGIPLYTRLWAVENDKIVVNKTVNMKDIEQTLPQDITKEWKEDLKQYYAEYVQGKRKYSMWIEDAKSIQAKVSLVHQYKLAGIATWEKDRENEEIWNIIAQELSN